MTQQEIYNIVTNTEWRNSTNKLFANTDELSEIVAFWNEDVSFLVHAIRLKHNKNKCLLVVNQVAPTKRFDIELKDIVIDWNNNNLKSMNSKEMLQNKTIHNKFLKKK